MSIYKTRPELSLDFVIQPFDFVFSLVVEESRAKVLDNETNHSCSFPSPISFLSDYDTEYKRLFLRKSISIFELGRSNTQHNSGVTENADTQRV